MIDSITLIGSFAINFTEGLKMKSILMVLKIIIGLAIIASLESALGMQPRQLPIHQISSQWSIAPLLPQRDGVGFVPQQQPKKPAISYGTGYEAQTIKKELGDFIFKESAAYAAIVYNFGENLRLKELRYIIESARYFLRERGGIELPELSRNTKRSFPLLVKYINDNYNNIVPLFGSIILTDANRQPIPLLDSGINLGDPPPPQQLPPRTGEQ
ncbi:MAG: hypothetical protein LBG04_00510 [Holosporaceae bacterium]|jgi:hypothetical protein|nr:hypothetical protein [Holosporaceae bacterium]